MCSVSFKNMKKLGKWRRKTVTCLKKCTAHKRYQKVMSLRNSAVAVYRKYLIQDLKSVYCFAKVSAVAITRPLVILR